MLDNASHNAHWTRRVAILTREGCGFCATAKGPQSDAGYDYVEIPLPHTIRSRAIGAIADAATVPQVFINERLLGSSAQIGAHLRNAARGT